MPLPVLFDGYPQSIPRKDAIFLLTDLRKENIIDKLTASGCGEVWYRAWFGSKRPRVRIPALRPSVSLYGTHRFFIYIFHFRIVIIIVAWKCATFCDLGLIRYDKGPVDTTATPTEHIIHYTLQAKSCAKGQAPLEPPDNKAG